MRATGTWGYVNPNEFAAQVSDYTKSTAETRETELARGLRAAFDNLAERKRRGENVDYELMNLRIHAATQGYKNTREGRLDEARAEAELARRKQEKWSQKTQGQSAEAFYKEVSQMTLEQQQFEEQQRKELGIEVKQQPTREERYQKIYQSLGKDVEGIQNDQNH